MNSTKNNSMDTKEAVNRAVLATAIAAGALASSCTPRNNNNVQQAEQESNTVKEQIIPEDDPISITNPANQQSSLPTLEVTDYHKETQSNIEDPTEEPSPEIQIEKSADAPIETVESTDIPTEASESSSTETQTTIDTTETLTPDEIQETESIWKLNLPLAEAFAFSEEHGLNLKWENFYFNYGTIVYEKNGTRIIDIQNDNQIEEDIRRDFYSVPSGTVFVDVEISIKDNNLMIDNETVSETSEGKILLTGPDGRGLFLVTE